MNSVSVVIPAYRAERFVKRCFDSIAQQTVMPDEIVVVVDGCERTLGALEAAVTPRVKPNLATLTRVIWLPENLGAESIGRVYNIGMICARGDTVMFFDVDDEMMPHYVESMLGIVNDGDFAVARQVVYQNGEVKNPNFVCSCIAGSRVSLMSAGGYEPWPCEEDSEFIHRLRQMGYTVRPPGEHNMVRNKEEGSITLSERTGIGTDLQQSYYRLRESRKKKPVVPDSIAIGKFVELYLFED